MEKLTFLELAKKVLFEENKALTAEEIWKIGDEKGYASLVLTKGRTPWRTMGAQIYVSMKNDENTPFIKMGTSPQTFNLRANLSQKEIEELDNKPIGFIKETEKKLAFTERELHPFLTYFVHTYYRIYTKTIYHEKSTKQKYAQWLHPDIVGVYLPLGEWKKEVVDLSKAIGTPYVRFYSFELKRELNFSNLREAFFQTVSNSSWANNGYLVAAEIDEDPDFLSELKRLSMSFGIGVIKIDIESPDDSEILFQPRFNTDLDWDAINKLAEENIDFKDFLNRVTIDLAKSDVYNEKYDKVYILDALIKLIKKKH
ncbi:MAG: hypothetical protein HPY60_05715 [Candidatus Methanofastidiosum sp.]|nr:hypothetical protein [Methanofastidiosum sp.]